MNRNLWWVLLGYVCCLAAVVLIGLGQASTFQDELRQAQRLEAQVVDWQRERQGHWEIMNVQLQQLGDETRQSSEATAELLEALQQANPELAQAVKTEQRWRAMEERLEALAAEIARLTHEQAP